MKLAFIAAVALLAGCNATTQQARRPTSADDPTLGCYQAVANMHQLAPIAKRIPLANARDATVEMLADPGRPTEEEKAALSLWAKNRADCTGAGRSFRAQHAPPGWANVIEAGQVEMLQAISRLYAGELTYGQFNRERQQLGTRLAVNLDAVVKDAQRAARAAQQDAALENAQMLQTMQLLQAMQPQTVIAPPMLRPPVNCVSRRVGSQVYTDCN